MARAHYIVRVGNEGLARNVSDEAPNHWHYLSPQRLWGFPRGLKQFLCNGHGGPGHFVGVGIGRRHLGQGPVRNATLPIPDDIMARLEGFDHWFEWQPVNHNAAFQRRVYQLPIPHPPYIPTLRRVTGDHPSFPLFQAVIDAADQHAPPVATTTALPQVQATTVALPQAVATSTTLPAATPSHPAIEVDLENLRREQTNPHSQGHIYLIHMSGTNFYKVGMSLDPQIRLRTLQTGNPHLLHLLNTQVVQDMRSAEVNLHRQFETKRVPNVNVREWFDFDHGTNEVENAFATLG